MNELLQKHGCANVFTIPEGLKELMSDISREVLRDQPSKIYDFIANYISVLLITREHGILAVRVLDDLCDCRPSVAEHLNQIGLSGEESLTVADIIKNEIESTEPTEGKEKIKEAQIIKRILTKVLLDEVKTAKVCQIARNAYREYWYRKKLLEQSLKTTPDEPWQIAAERTLQIYKSTKPSFTELSRAAEKIQAAYRGYHIRRHLLGHLKPKKKKRGPKLDLPGSPLDIAASREIDLGPLINIKVRKDDVNSMFDEHATTKLGLPYNPQTAITHVEDMEHDETVAPEAHSRADSQVVDIKSAKSLLKSSHIPVSDGAMESEVPPRRGRLASRAPEPMLRQTRLPSQVSESGASQVQSGHLSFAEIPHEIIPDKPQEVQEEIQTAADTQKGEEGAIQEPSEVPEHIIDERTEGDGESTPAASVPTSAPETDVSEVEDIAEDMTTSGEEEETLTIFTIMDDLLQSQIQESCRLALPVGLKELMSDISREVLRSQPENLYQFIADYLQALLNAREVLSIACRICGELRKCSCQPQLNDELSRVGLSDEDVVKARDIILDHFDKGQVQETNLLIKLATKTNVTKSQLAKVQKAVQRAFQRHISKRKDLQVSFAQIYDDSTEPSQGSGVSSVSTQSFVSDFYKPPFSLDAISAIERAQAKQLFSSPAYSQLNPTVSATTLAGSYVNLPLRIPYSVHNSECENILVKSEKSVLSLIKSFLFAEDRQYQGIRVDDNTNKLQSLDSIESESYDDEEINDAIKSIFNRDLYEVQSKNSKESDDIGIFKATHEDLYDSSSGGS